jgi:transcriptional regulator with XRE-family HTH domain
VLPPICSNPAFQLLRKPQSYVSKYELGERRINVVELIEIAEVLGIMPEQLLREVRTV